MEQLIKYLIDIILGIAGFFAVRVLDSISKNQDKLSERLDSTVDKVDDIDTRVTVLETEHELIGKKGHCAKE